MNVVLSSFYGFSISISFNNDVKMFKYAILKQTIVGDIMNFHVIQSIKDEYYDKAITFIINNQM